MSAAGTVDLLLCIRRLSHQPKDILNLCLRRHFKINLFGQIGVGPHIILQLKILKLAVQPFDQSFSFRMPLIFRKNSVVAVVAESASEMGSA